MYRKALDWGRIVHLQTLHIYIARLKEEGVAGEKKEGVTNERRVAGERVQVKRRVWQVLLHCQREPAQHSWRACPRLPAHLWRSSWVSWYELM